MVEGYADYAWLWETPGEWISNININITVTTTDKHTKIQKVIAFINIWQIVDGGLTMALNTIAL